MKQSVQVYRFPAVSGSEVVISAVYKSEAVALKIEAEGETLWWGEIGRQKALLISDAIYQAANFSRKGGDK